MHVLAIEHLRKEFAGSRVLDGVHLEVHPGEIVSLLGPSGCGKSTLLRIVAGLDPAYDGVVRIAGRDLGGPAPEVGVVFQEPRLLPWLTVWRNIAFGSRVSDREIREIAGLVGLAHALDVLPKQLSGGMAQRCALARTLLRRPSCLLLDEPFSALDAFTRMQLHELILGIRDRYGTAMLLVTHDIREAIYLSDRIALMGDRPGRILDVVSVKAPQPRDRADPYLAELEGELLYKLGFGRSMVDTQERRELDEPARDPAAY